MTTLFGGLLMAIGLLIALLSGLCSAVFLAKLASGSGFNGAGLVIVGVVGGIPFLGGVGMFFGGLTLVRNAWERGK